MTNGNVWTNQAEILGNGIDDDGNGFVDDVIGYDFVSGTLAGTTCRDPTAPRPTTTRWTAKRTARTWPARSAAITNNGNRVAGIAGGVGDGTADRTRPTASSIIPLRIGLSRARERRRSPAWSAMDLGARRR